MIRHDGYAAAGHAGHDSLVIKDVSVSKDVYVNKDVIASFELKTDKKYRPEDACVDYQYHVLSAIELLDVNNATCKDLYRDLRTGVNDRTLFDYCLESIFVKDEVQGIL